MKRFLAVSVLPVQVLILSAALANAAVVNFNSLGINSTDITVSTNPAGLTLDGVTFKYDNFGTTLDDDYGQPVAALVDAAGVFGNTYGGLVLDFSAPVTSLTVQFSLVGVAESESVADALFALLNNGNADVADLAAAATFVPYDSGDPLAGGDAFGTLVYSGAPINHAEMYFSLDAPSFTVNGLSYESVPEPTTLVLVASSALLCWRRRLA